MTIISPRTTNSTGARVSSYTLAKLIGTTKRRLRKSNFSQSRRDQYLKAIDTLHSSNKINIESFKGEGNGKYNPNSHLISIKPGLSLKDADIALGQQLYKYLHRLEDTPSSWSTHRANEIGRDGNWSPHRTGRIVSGVGRLPMYDKARGLMPGTSGLGSFDKIRGDIGATRIDLPEIGRITDKIEIYRRRNNYD